MRERRTHPTRPPPARDDGVALLLALVLLCLIAAFGSALVGLTTTERAMAGNHGMSLRGRYAADALAERVVLDLSSVTDWTAVLAGTSSSSFFDEAAATSTPGLDPLDLSGLTTALQGATDGASIVGADTPVWRLFAAGTLAALTGLPRAGPPVFLAAWVADDAADGDGAPGVDANGIVEIRAEAFGADGMRQAVQITLRRGVLYSPETPPGETGEPDAARDAEGLAPIMPNESGAPASAPGPVRLLTWRDVR
ncbi:MAG TPA: hypothetical protein VG538_11700 [Vicinamibacterales bacterium]|nr:hypothetical protein [Vicinamibacterales bacterium]